MSTPDLPWWSPDVLAERERAIRSGIDPEASDIRNDFSSYKALLSSGSTNSSGLYMHNEFEPWRIDTVCGNYATLTRSLRDRAPKTIADLGCGAGFTTDGLHRVWSSALVTGFDVSVDAVQFARQRWPRCVFVDGAITPNAMLDGAPFDLLLCQEFYPFTRTGSLVVHREWLRCLVNNMSDDGLAIIMVAASTRDSINETYESLRSEFALHKVPIATPRISRRLPFALARLTGRAISIVRPVWVRNHYVLQRQ